MWRKGKKKGLEEEEERPEDRDEVSATQWGRTERAGGVAARRGSELGSELTFETGQEVENAKLVRESPSCNAIGRPIVFETAGTFKSEL